MALLAIKRISMKLLYICPSKMIKISPLEQQRSERKDSKGSHVTEIALRWNAYREDKIALNMEVSSSGWETFIKEC